MNEILYRLDHLSDSEVILICMVLTLIAGYSYVYFANRKKPS